MEKLFVGKGSIAVPVFFLIVLLGALGVNEAVGQGAGQCQNVAGIWQSVEISTNMGCPSPSPKTEKNEYAFMQDGCRLTVRDKNRGASYEGAIKGNIVTWKGTFHEIMGYNEWTSVELRVGVDGKSLEGVTAWAYRGHSDIVCDGNTRMIMRRISAK